MKLVSPSPTVCDVRDLSDGSPVDQVLLVREREIRGTRAGGDYMRLALADRTGVLPAVVRDDVEQAAATATAGEPVRVIGTFSEHPRYGPQLTVQTVSPRSRSTGSACSTRRPPPCPSSSAGSTPTSPG